MRITNRKKPKITGLTCTNGRFSYLERLLACFQCQEYENKHLLIFNNSDIKIEIKHIKNVVLINNHLDKQTNDKYTDVGSIYRDAFEYISTDTDFVSIMDDDDIFLPNHFSLGVDALLQNPQYKVWRPGCYFYRYGWDDVEFKETDNNLEGSCILDYSFLRKYGFETNTSLTYHLQWLHEAMKQNVFYQDKRGVPSFCCEYGQQNVFHISGYSFANPSSNRLDFEKFIKANGDYGEGKILKPWKKKRLELFFDVFFDLKNFEEVKE